MSKLWKILCVSFAIVAFLVLLKPGYVPEQTISENQAKSVSQPTDKSEHACCPHHGEEAGGHSDAAGTDPSSPAHAHVANLPVLDNSVRDLDPFFKSLDAQPLLEGKYGAFQFLSETSVGDRISFELRERSFTGTVTAAKNADHAYQRVVQLDNDLGRTIVNLDGNGVFRMDMLFSGDSRVVRINRLNRSGEDLVAMTGDLSNIVCAPDGAVFQPEASAPIVVGAKPTPSSGNIAAAQPIFTTDGSDAYVLYIDFDGEPVSNTPWNDGDTLTLIEAAAHPKANDVDWVQFVWNRVAEDFAPFDITVTTDRDIYEAADLDKRIMAIVTPTSDWYPIRFPGETSPGGVAFLGSFNDLDPVVWVFNFEEYSVADTISHEVGHALKLSHDGRGTFDEYYGGHGPQTSEVSWAPIMGAPWSDEGGPDSYDNVTQWSQGEYDSANNTEDDIGLISDTSTTPPLEPFLLFDGPHGFGFKVDDHADSIAGVGQGGFTLTNNTNVSASGLVETRDDVDVFVFDTVAGTVDLTVSPIDVMSDVGERGSDTMGANLAVRAQLLDASGTVLADVSPTDQLSASLEVDVAGGTHYLTVQGAGRLTPITGFSDYASLGSYSISGTIAAPPLSVFGGSKQDILVPAGSVEPSAVNGTDYGFVVTGSSQSSSTRNRVFNLENTSASPITILSAAFDSGAAFEIVSGPTTINPGTTVPVTIRFSATSNGLYRDTLRISYDSNFPNTLEASFAFEATGVGATFRDNYEYNNSVPNAYDLDALQDIWLSDHKGLAINADFVDFYDLEASANDVVLFVEALTDPIAPANIAVSLHSSDGVQRAVMSFNNGVGLLRFGIPPGATNRYFYIKVFPLGGQPDGLTYDLRWGALEDDGNRSEDFYEENDSLGEAYDLSAQPVLQLSEILGEAIQADEDWYRFEVPRDPRLRLAQIECTFDQTLGDIDIALYGPRDENTPDPVLLERSVSATDDEFLSYFAYVPIEVIADDVFPAPFTGEVTGLFPGTYYVQVTNATGTPTNNLYDLNIEFLEDDNYEVVSENTENDTRRNAFDLGGQVVGRFLSSIDGLGVLADYPLGADANNFNYNNDDDWYRFTLDEVPGAVTQFSLSLRSGISGWVRCEITTGTGRLIASGETPGDSTFFFNGIDLADGNVFDLDSQYSEIVLEVTDPADVAESEYFVRIWGWDSTDPLNSYDFTVDVGFDPPLPPSGTLDDNYEENDDYLSPHSLGNADGAWLATIDGYGILSDNDWYTIQVPQNASNLTVELVHDASEGNIDMTLFNSSEQLVFREDNGVGQETISWDSPKAGEYFIGLSGDYTETLYNLRWQTTRFEDNYEENDTIVDADDRFAALGDFVLPEQTWLRKVSGLGVQSDDDWYKIAVQPGDAELEVRADFDHFEGDIDMEIFNEDGFIVARSVTTSSDEVIQLPNPPAGDYYIRLYFGDASNSYDLWWRAATQAEIASIFEDNYEENDFLGAAYNLGNLDQQRLSETDGLATQTDEDWYQIEIEDRNLGLLVDLDFVHSDGDIDLEVYDSSGSVIAFSRSESDDEIVDIPISLPAGAYFIRVYGANTGNSYDFFWVDRNEDIFEQNDTRETARSIDQESGTPLSTLGIPTQGDEDWYSFTSTADEAFASIAIDFVHANGNIDLELRDETGAVVASSVTAEDAEFIFQRITAGTYFIRVFGEDRYNDYDLLWELFEDDEFEQNDTRANAADVRSSAGETLIGAQFDQDWYQIAVSDFNTTVFVNVSYTFEDGDVELRLYDDLGSEIAVSDSGEGSEAVSVEAPSPGDYFIRVSGDNLNPSYTLIWNSIADDSFEQNDELLEAAPLDADTVIDGIQLDEDWFEVVVPAGDVRFEANLTFLHSEGDLSLEILDGAGNVLRIADSATDDEQLVFGPDPAGQTYYLRVNGSNIGTEYSLSWSSTTRDGYEGDGGNNTIDDAVDLNSNEGRYLTEDEGQATLFDEDWYQINHSGEGILIQVEFAHINGNIDVDLFRDVGDGVLVATAVSTSDIERLVYFGESDTYYIRLYGDLNGNQYDLFWRSFDEDDLEEFDAQNDLDNDVDVQAVSLTGRELDLIENLTQLDDDWYVIDAVAGDLISVNLEFEHLGGDIAVELFDPSGSSIAQVDSSDDNESLSAIASVDGDYVIRVHGRTLTDFTNGTPVSTRDLANTYSLRWNSATEDAYEENDAISQANTTLPSLSIDDEGYTLGSLPAGGGVQFDEDWYEVTVGGSGSETFSLFVSLLYEASEGSLGLEVYDPSETLLASSTTGQSPDQILISEISTSVPAVYYIRVFGEDVGQSYDLDISTKPDDQFEQNDTFAEADANADITLLDGFLLDNLFQIDDDYYRLTVPAGQLRLLVTLALDPDFTGLGLTLFDSNQTQVASANSADGQADLDFIVPEAGGDYYLLVDGPGERARYELLWIFTDDDRYEDNDSALDPTELVELDDQGALEIIYEELSENEGDGPATLLNDDDWYSVILPDGHITLNVEILFAHTAGDLALEVWDSTGLTRLAESNTGDDNETLTVALPTPNSSTYLIRVTGDTGGNRYSLTWSSNTEDLYEDNDFITEAFDLTARDGEFLVSVNGWGATLDDDWYVVVVSDGSTQLAVELTIISGGGAIFEVYQLVEADPVEVNDPTVDQRRARLVVRPVPSAGTTRVEVPITPTGAFNPGLYYVRVSSLSGRQNYDLFYDDGVVADDSSFTDDLGNFTFSNPDPTAPPSDFLENSDGDRFPNWAEYALGLDQDAPDVQILDQSIREIDGKDYYTIEFVRDIEAVARGFRYIVEESLNLIFDGAEAVHVSSEPISATLERVVYRCSKPLEDAPVCFFKLRVELPASGF